MEELLIRILSFVADATGSVIDSAEHSCLMSTIIRRLFLATFDASKRGRGSGILFHRLAQSKVLSINWEIAPVSSAFASFVVFLDIGSVHINHALILAQVTQVHVVNVNAAIHCRIVDRLSHKSTSNGLIS